MKFSSLLATIAGATTMLLLTPGATAQKVASNPSDACNSKWHCSVGNYCAWYTDGNSAGGVTEGTCQFAPSGGNLICVAGGTPNGKCSG